MTGREEEILGKIKAKYEESMSPYYAPACHASRQAGRSGRFNMGVLQT